MEKKLNGKHLKSYIRSNNNKFLNTYSRSYINTMIDVAFLFSQNTSSITTTIQKKHNRQNAIDKKHLTEYYNIFIDLWQLVIELTFCNQNKELY